jgi:hypothetical protein
LAQHRHHQAASAEVRPSALTQPPLQDCGDMEEEEEERRRTNKWKNE